MPEAEALYHEIALGLPDATKGKMFGALCLKAANGKAGVMFWKDYMIFKLDAENQSLALELNEAKIFEPAPGRPMGGWVQLSIEHKDKWKDLAHKAMTFVKAL